MQSHKPFWKHKWSANNICPITHSRLRPGKNKHGIHHTIRLDCNHRFYRNALIIWILSNNSPTCPICRQQITSIPNIS